VTSLASSMRKPLWSNSSRRAQSQKAAASTAFADESDWTFFNAVCESRQVRLACDRRLGISRSKSRTVAVVRAVCCLRAFSNPMLIRSCRVSGTVLGAKTAKGESGSVAQVQMSEKKVRTATNRECAVILVASSPARRRRTSRARSIAQGMYERA